MRILQVNCVYKKGSTGKIVYDHHTELLKRGVQSIVAYVNGPKVQEQGVYKISNLVFQKFSALRARITGLMYGGCVLQTRRLISLIKKQKPDIVHLHCINGYTANIYKLIEWLKNNHVKTVLTQHAEFLYTANCGYAYECEKWKTGCGNCTCCKKATNSWFFDGTHKSWKKMKQAFNGFDELIVTSVSPWLMDRAKQSPILSDKRHEVVYNGLDGEVFSRRDGNGLKETLGIKNEKIVFHATSEFSADPSHRKGGYYVLKLAERFKQDGVRFIVAGNCNLQVENVPENVTLLGRIDDQKMLAEYYALADVTLLTSARETFSMICAESLCCGTPVVGFKAGAPEQISLAEHSKFVEYGDVDGLATELEYILNENMTGSQRVRISEAAKACYAKESMTAQYYNIYETLMKQ